MSRDVDWGASRRRRAVRVLSSCLGLVAWTACSDPLKPPALVAETRVLAARLEVATDPERAWPAVGETATVHWLVGEPAEPRVLGWHVDVCVAAPTMRGVPQCAAAPFNSLTRPEPQLGEPRVDFVVPDEAELGGAEQLLLLSIVCAGGRPDARSPWPSWRCVGDGVQASIASFEVTIQRGEQSNRNPSMSDDVVSLDGVQWAPPVGSSEPPAGCAALPSSAALPVVPANGGDHTVSLAVHGPDREALSPVSSLSPSREALHVAHLATAGELEGLFTVIEADDQREVPTVDVIWTAPTEIGADGWRTRFYFVVRDQRGGADWTTREACVVP